MSNATYSPAWAKSWWVCWVCSEKVSEAEYFTAKDGVTRIIHGWCLADARKQDRREG